MLHIYIRKKEKKLNVLVGVNYFKVLRFLSFHDKTPTVFTFSNTSAKKRHSNA